MSALLNINQKINQNQNINNSKNNSQGGNIEQPENKKQLRIKKIKKKKHKKTHKQYSNDQQTIKKKRQKRNKKNKSRKLKIQKFQVKEEQDDDQISKTLIKKEQLKLQFQQKSNITTKRKISVKKDKRNKSSSVKLKQFETKKQQKDLQRSQLHQKKLRKNKKIVEKNDGQQSRKVQQIKLKHEESRVGKCTVQQSIRIINIFEFNAGDYKKMVEQLKDIPLKKIRAHLKMLFERSIQIITNKMLQSKKDIKKWQRIQKRQIIRQLHRIRHSNRLLSQQNINFRHSFIKLMMTYNDQNIELTGKEYEQLYRKIQAFVRGFCSIESAKKRNQYNYDEREQQNRQPLLQGGYIMGKNRAIKQVKLQGKLQQQSQRINTYAQERKSEFEKDSQIDKQQYQKQQILDCQKCEQQPYLTLNYYHLQQMMQSVLEQL